MLFAGPPPELPRPIPRDGGPICCPPCPNEDSRCNGPPMSSPRSRLFGPSRKSLSLDMGPPSLSLPNGPFPGPPDIPKGGPELLLLCTPWRASLISSFVNERLRWKFRGLPGGPSDHDLSRSRSCIPPGGGGPEPLPPRKVRLRLEDESSFRNDMSPLHSRPLSSPPSLGGIGGW